MLTRSSMARALLALGALSLLATPPTSAQIATEATSVNVTDAVEREFLEDPSVPFHDIDVATHDGIVTLKGEVDDILARERAVRIAEIRSAFGWDPYLWSHDVDVTVRSGIVYLGGTVASHLDRARAEDVASRVGGVIDVVNDLEVETNALGAGPLVDPWTTYDVHGFEPPSLVWKPDRRLANDIESQLWWSPFVDEGEVTVGVSDGVATLSGTVDSWMERGAAQDNAYDAGAALVRNHLEVD